MKFRQNLPEQSSGSKGYVKLRDKESVTGIFRGDPREFFVVWKDGKSIEVPEGTAGSKFRFRINFVVKEGASYVPKIFEQGQVVYEQLSAFHQEYDLEKTVMKITRNGEKLDTSYTIMPLRDPVAPATEVVLSTLKYHDLKGKASEAPMDNWTESEPPPPDMHDEIPF